MISNLCWKNEFIEMNNKQNKTGSRSRETENQRPPLLKNNRYWNHERQWRNLVRRDVIFLSLSFGGQTSKDIIPMMMGKESNYLTYCFCYSSQHPLCEYLHLLSSIVPYQQTTLIYTTVKNKWLVSATTSTTTSATLRRLHAGWIVLRSIVN